MKKVLQSIVSIGLLGLVLSSCELLASLNASCRNYNNIVEDGFQMSISQNEIILTLNQIGNIGLNQSWLAEVNNSLVRRDVTCTPNWSYVPTGIVEVTKEDTRKLRAVAVGISRVTATATGYNASPDSFWALVNPVSTETNAPNDTFDLANPITSSVIGTIVGSDLDFWKFEVPVTKSYRIALSNAVDLSPAGGNLFASYTANFYTSNQTFINTPVTNRLEGINSSNATQTIYVRVTGDSQSDTPYQVKLELF